MKAIISVLLIFLFAACGGDSENHYNCGDQNCSDHETCVEGHCIDLSGRCDCNGWEECNPLGECVLLPNRCNDHGDCDGGKSCFNHVCIVQPGSCQSDRDCDDPYPYCNEYKNCVMCKGDLHCSSRERCSAGKCVLKEGYCTDSGQCGNDQICGDDGRCIFDCNRCPEGSRCNSEQNGCMCGEGYRLEGDRCVDIDECAGNSNLCEPLSVCHNTEGGYECRCVVGYHREGAQCVLDTKYVPCFNRAPEHKIVTIEDVLIWWRDGEWESPRDCHWCCKEGSHTEDQIHCVLNTKKVPCKESAPENGVSLIEDVEVVWVVEQWSDDHWSEPALCNWRCKEGFELEDGSCVELDECVGLSIGNIKLKNIYYGFEKSQLSDIDSSYEVSLEFYQSTPVGTYNLASAENSNYVSCKQCIRVIDHLDDQFYFQKSGTIVVTEGDVVTDISSGQISNVILEEVTINQHNISTPVKDGRCLEIEFAEWNTAIKCEEGHRKCEGRKLLECLNNNWETVITCGETQKCSREKCVNYNLDECTGLSLESLSILTDFRKLEGIIGDYKVSVELYNATPIGIYDLGSAGVNDNYSTCNQCVHVVDQENSREFFQKSGTMIVSKGDAESGDSSGQIIGIILEEVIINPASGWISTPVPNGECLEIETASWNTIAP